ncbi:ribosome maturation protein RimP [Sphingomonas sp.]|uniref:ribosome maturation protein RimP n=1 Tax=Sphingomonas sp. TaxID=28214 RepID=UPI003CC6340C
MTDLPALTALIEPEATALGFALVRVKLFGGADEPTLQVMAERPDTRQLTIDDCAALSRRVSEALDAVEGTAADPFDGEYRLEVSSPGIDRPLTRLADFRDWQGHEARITLTGKLDGRRQFKGMLAGVDPEGVIALDLGKDEHAYIPFDAIADAKLALTDRLIAATQPLSADGAEEELEEDLN